MHLFSVCEPFRQQGMPSAPYLTSSLCKPPGMNNALPGAAVVLVLMSRLAEAGSTALSVHYSSWRSSPNLLGTAATQYKLGSTALLQKKFQGIPV